MRCSLRPYALGKMLGFGADGLNEVLIEAVCPRLFSLDGGRRPQ